MGGSIIGGITSAIGGENAAGAEEAGQQQAANNYSAFWQSMQKQLQPYLNVGTGATTGLEGLLGLPGGQGNIQQTLSNLPGYQFALGQGLKSTQNGYAARGLGTSGASEKGAANFATGLANQNYGQYFNQMMQAAGIGQNATQQYNQGAEWAGSGMSNAYIGAGNASAGGQATMWNGIGNSLGAVANLGLGVPNYSNIISGQGSPYTSGLFGNVFGSPAAANPSGMYGNLINQQSNQGYA